MLINDKEIIWFEKYRPQLVEDLILPNEYISKFKKFIDKPSHILLASETPGTGKTSTMNALKKEGNFETLFINASLDRGIDLLHSKIKNFASTKSFNDKHKLVILDECLEENERVIIKVNGVEVPKRLKDLSRNKIYDCISFNMETGEIEDDTCEIISEKEEEIYEVELEDGRKIKITANHPFIINQNGKFIEKSILDGLSVNDDVVCREEYDIPQYDKNMGVHNYLKKYNFKKSDLPKIYMKLNNCEIKKCLYCGKDCKFISLTVGFSGHCGSKECAKKYAKYRNNEHKKEQAKLFDNFILENKEFYNSVTFPFKDIYKDRVIKNIKQFKLLSYSSLKVLDFESKCPICGGVIINNKFLNVGRNKCLNWKCVSFNSFFRRKLIDEDFIKYKNDIDYNTIKLCKKNNVDLEFVKELKDKGLQRKAALKNIIKYENYTLFRNQSKDKFSFIRNNIITEDMLNTCSVCNKEYIKYDKIVENNVLKTIKYGAEYTCSRKCYNDILKQGKFVTLDGRKKQSNTIKNKIAKGEFTPCITNSWTKTRIYYNNMKFRSSWELLFYLIMTKIHNIKLEYEKIRIKYKDENNNFRNYIVDFYDETNKTLYEIKPLGELTTKNAKLKIKYAIKYSNENNITFKVIDDNWFKENYNDEILKFIPEEERLKYTKLWKQFKGDADENKIN